jgi:hypothetical protein
MAIKYEKCKFPPCQGSVTPAYSKIGLCNRHGDMLEFVLWVLNSIKVREDKEEVTEAPKTPSNLILPKN